MVFEEHGLIQLGKKSPIISPSDIVYVFWHPFLGIYHLPYIKNISEVISDSESVILTIDDFLLLSEGINHSTIDGYALLEPRGDRFFLKAGWRGPKPFCGWTNTAKIINTFEPTEVIFGGAFLGGNEKYGYLKCVGTGYETLKGLVPNPQIKESLCYRLYPF